MMVDDKILVRLARWLQAEGAPAPVVLSGEGGDEMIQELVKLAVCLEPGTRQACGQCTGCTTAPTDVLSLDNKGASLGIDEVRRLTKTLRLTSLSRRRLAVIPDAERLTMPGANALLKLLEELATETRLVLTTRLPRRLLPTILSRCQLIRLGAAETREDGAGRARWNDSAVLRLAKAEQYTEDDIDALGRELVERVRQSGASGSRLALLRLRDYYKVKAMRGNVKLARDVFLASLPE